MAQGFGKRVLKPQEQREANILKRSVLQYFQTLEDPRVERGQHHCLASDAVRHAQVIRSHWSVENSLHWVLDVTFNEDGSRIRRGYAAQNMALLRRLSVSLLKREPSKMSLVMKRYTAALDNNFLLKILAASAPE